MFFALPFLSILGLAVAMELIKPIFIKPGQYRIVSQWGGICWAGELQRFQTCEKSENSTIWTFSCSAEGVCHLETDEGKLGIKAVRYLRFPILSQRTAPVPVKFICRSETPEGKLCHISLGFDESKGHELFLDSDRYDTKVISAHKYRNFSQQQFTIKPIPDIKPGKYFIRSKSGFLCADLTGKYFHCYLHGIQPQVWDLVESDGEFYLSNGVGNMFAGLGEKRGSIFTLDEHSRSPIVLEAGSAPLQGDTSVKIKIDHKHYLDADRNNPHFIQPWTVMPFVQQDWVFVPVSKLGGMKTSFSELTTASNLFESTCGRFPIKSNTVETLSQEIDGEDMARDAERAEIFMETSTYDLILKFLDYKKVLGNQVEQAVYAQVQNAEAFIDRLLQKRPLVFYTSRDLTLRRGAPSLENLSDDWALVGKVDSLGNSIEGDLKMEDYLTYAEMELAALVNVCTATRFINNGNRNNHGSHTLHPPTPGYFLSGVGARFEIPGRMEFRHMALRREEPIPAALSSDTFERMWQQFYEITQPPTEEEYEGKYIRLHIPTFKARLRKTILPILKEANLLGQRHGLKACLRLVGFGLGVWGITDVDQQKHLHTVVMDLIKQGTYDHISRVDMLWMGRTGETQQVLDAKENSIPLVFSRGNPADPVGPGELLVATYAWDGNSFAGNEYWLGQLAASGDPAAAACSTIQEMQNPLINKCLTASNNLALFA